MQPGTPGIFLDCFAWVVGYRGVEGLGFGRFCRFDCLKLLKELEAWRVLELLDSILRCVWGLLGREFGRQRGCVRTYQKPLVRVCGC